MKIFPLLFSPEGDAGGGGGGTLLSQAATNPAPSQSSQPPPSQDNPPAFDFRASLDDSGNFKPGWHNSLPDDLKPYASAVEKYPNPTELLRGLGNAQSLLGKRQSVQPPGADAKPEEVAAWNKLIGVPENADGYGFKKPEQLPKGVTWDDAAVKDFSAFAHSIGLTPAQANKLIEYDMGSKGKAFEMGEAKLAEYVQGQGAALRKEWGDSYQKNIDIAFKAAQAMGFDPEDPEIGNNAKMIQGFFAASQLMSEDKLVPPDKVGSDMTNLQAAEDIITNPNNPWYNAYHGKEGADRQAQAQQVRFRMMGYKQGK